MSKLFMVFPLGFLRYEKQKELKHYHQKSHKLNGNLTNCNSL
jgi:hypothetical protein